MGEYGLPAAKRIEYAEHIADSLIQHIKEQGIYTDDIEESIRRELKRQQKSFMPIDGGRLDLSAQKLIARADNKEADTIAADGKINADFKQSDVTGDCWLLSGIKAIAENPKTLEILNKCLKLNDDGSVTVTLKGAGNREYTISAAELKDANELSSGDLDVRAIEIAVNRYFEDTYDDSWSPHKKADINDNSLNKAFEVLLGASNYRDAFGLLGRLYGMAFDINDDLIEKVKSGNYLVLASHKFTAEGNISAVKSSGSSETIVSNHAYSIVDADDEYIYAVNPWNSSEKLKLTHEEFKKAFNQAGIVCTNDIN